MGSKLLIKDSLEAEKVRATLSKAFPKHLVCQPSAKLVVEGYLRTSNSYTVRMICEAAKGILSPTDLAHHTHDARNLALARFHEIPRLVLIRNPEEAILSLHIRSNNPVPACIERYVEFYADALEVGPQTAVVTFEQTTADFQTVIEKIRQISDLDIPIDQDYAKLTTDVFALVKKTVEKQSPDSAMRQMAAPHPEREKLKDAIRETVAIALKGRRDVWEAYEFGLSLAEAHA